MHSGFEGTAYSTQNQDTTLDFVAAAEFVGRDWLNEQHKKYYRPDSTASPIDSNAPEIIDWYHFAGQILPRQSFPQQFLGRNGNLALRFLELGYSLQHLLDAKVITKSGETTGKTIHDLYRMKLRTTNSNLRDVVNELLSAYWYVQAGHEVAFIDEEATSEKTPEFRVTDTSPAVDVECKRVRTESDNSRQLSQFLYEFSVYLANQINTPFIAYLETSHGVPREEIKEFIQDNEMNKSVDEYTKFELNECILHLLPVNETFPYEIHPNIVAKFGIETAAKRLLVNNTLSQQDIFKLNDELYQDFHYKSHATVPGRIGWCGWLGVDLENALENNVSRAERQFRGISGKFDSTRPSLLQLDFPSFLQIIDSHGDELRSRIKGEVRERPEVTGVLITEKNYQTQANHGDVVVTTTVIPHYNPHIELPSGLKPFGIDFDEAIKYNKSKDAAQPLTNEDTEISELLDINKIELRHRLSPLPLFSNQQYPIPSKSKNRMLMVGGGQNNWGRIDLIDVNQGIHRLTIPPRFRYLEKVHLNIIIKQKKFEVNICPVKQDVGVKPAKIASDAPIICSNRITSDIMADILSDFNFGR